MEFIPENQWIQMLIAAIIGYITGSISNARIISFLLTKTTKIEPIKAEVPGTDEMFESDSISATVVAQNHGPKYGCLTSLLDMLKVALPTLLIRLVFPDQPYYLLTAVTGILGHNYTIYHRFKGGRGESPIIGALIIINWFGIFICNLAALVLGFLTGRVLVIRYGWYVIMIFWFWIWFNTWYHVVFMVCANFLFWFSMRIDLARYAELEKGNEAEISEELVSEFLLMGKGLGRFLDNYSLPSLIRKLLS